MSLFLRRRLQQYVDDMEGKIPQNAMKKLVKALNGGGLQPLGTEWEVVLLWAFSRCFHVDYEPGHANASKLDLVIHNSPTLPPLFVADIRCVSDTGYHDANPVDRLSEILGVLKAEIHLSGEVGWNVTGAVDGEFRKGKMILNLPRGEEDWASPRTVGATN